MAAGVASSHPGPRRTLSRDVVARATLGANGLLIVLTLTGLDREVVITGSNPLEVAEGRRFSVRW
jgi:hypothetical protein